MLKKTVKNFLVVLFLLNATFVDALLPDYEYTENTPLYLKVYINELAEQQIEEGLYTDETINEFRQQKENLYLSILVKVKTNKSKPQINVEFDKKFPKKNKGTLLNLVAVLLEAEELNEDNVNDFIQKRQDRLLTSMVEISKKKNRKSDAYKEFQKKYYQNNKEHIRESQKKYKQSDAYKESQKKYQQSDASKENQKKYYQNNKERIREYQKEYYQRKKLLAQQGDSNVQQELLNKIQLLSDDNIQALIDASLEPDTPCSFDIPTPKTPSVAHYLLDLYQNGKSSVSFDEAVEDAIYEDDVEYQNEILQEDAMLSENIMFGKRKEFEYEKSSPYDNAFKKLKLDD